VNAIEACFTARVASDPESRMSQAGKPWMKFNAAIGEGETTFSAINRERRRNESQASEEPDCWRAYHAAYMRRWRADRAEARQRWRKEPLRVPTELKKMKVVERPLATDKKLEQLANGWRYPAT
jgi:hypothetical protein